MGDKIAEGQTRIDQHAALHWAYLISRKAYPASPNEEEPALDEVSKKINGMLTKLAHGENVDFEGLIRQIRECEGW